MLAIQHPCEDELKLYLLERLPARKSVRIAEHLVLCPACVERSAELEDRIYCVRQELSQLQPLDIRRYAPPVQLRRVAPVVFRAPNPSRGAMSAVAAAFVLTTSLGTLLFHRTFNSTPAAVPLTVIPTLSARSSPIAAEPALEPASFDEMLAEPVVRRDKLVRKTKPQLRVARHFVAPPARSYTHEPKYFSAPGGFGTFSVASVAMVGYTRLPTDVGQMPDWPVTTVKRNKLLRFFNAIAKPFLPDRT
jgi:hypothetical protein